MKYKIIGIRDGASFEISPCMIDYYIRTHGHFDDISFIEYLFDESKNVCRIKCIADLGIGSHAEFIIGPVETYSSIYTEIFVDGPTDWHDVDYETDLQLVEAESE